MYNRFFKENKLVIICIVFSVVVTGTLMCISGCKQVSKMKNDTMDMLKGSKKSIESVENLELAKLILKPKREKIDITKDPFEPLGRKTNTLFVNDNPMDTVGIKSFRFLGVAKFNDEYVALLKNGSERGTFRIDDKLDGYTIKKIQPDKVILSNGLQIVTLKRSESK